MYIKKVSGYVLSKPVFPEPQLKGLLDIYIPQTVLKHKMEILAGDP